MSPVTPARVSATEYAAGRLEETGDYRVLRRLERRLVTATVASQWTEPVRYGAYVDVETTDDDPAACEIVQLAMLLFAFTDEGQLLGVLDSYATMNEPRKRPISLGAMQVHHITYEATLGRHIDRERVGSMLHSVSLVAAHNASFDRRVLERELNVFSVYPWACSFRDVDWKKRGHSCAKLEHLLAFHAGEFYDAHDALADCYAGLRILTVEPDVGQQLPLAELLDGSRQTHRVWAGGAPFGLKDALKSRGYLWSPGDDRRRKAWHFDTPDSEDADRESAWLRSQNVTPHVVKIPAIDRYSVREARY